MSTPRNYGLAIAVLPNTTAVDMLIEDAFQDVTEQGHDEDRDGEAFYALVWAQIVAEADAKGLSLR